MTSRSTGDHAEALARAHLEAAGLRCLASNYALRAGELDLVMRDGDVLVFVEVRYRRTTRFGGGAASITKGKQQKLRRAAEHYRLHHPRHQRRPCRFDVVAVAGAGDELTLDWIRDAF